MVSAIKYKGERFVRFMRITPRQERLQNQLLLQQQFWLRVRHL
jgi:hypothetical protein